MNVNVVCPHCFKVNRIPKKDTYAKANCGGCKNSLLDSSPVNVDADKFGIFIANSEIPVIVDFWAPWCGPCLQMAPAFEEVAKEMPLKAQFIKVNTDEQQTLGGRYQIQSIPTIMAFKGGKEIDRVSGALQSLQLRAWVKRHI